MSCASGPRLTARIIAEPPPVPEFQLPSEGISSIVAPPPDETDTAVIAPGGGGQPVDTSEPVVAAVSDVSTSGSVRSVQKIGGTQTPATPKASGEKTPPLGAEEAPPSSDVRQAVLDTGLVNKDTLAKYSVNKADLYRMLDFHRQFPAEKDLFVAPTAIEQQDGSVLARIGGQWAILRPESLGKNDLSHMTTTMLRRLAAKYEIPNAARASEKNLPDLLIAKITGSLPDIKGQHAKTVQKLAREAEIPEDEIKSSSTVELKHRLALANAPVIKGKLNIGEPNAQFDSNTNTLIISDGDKQVVVTTADTASKDLDRLHMTSLRAIAGLIGSPTAKTKADLLSNIVERLRDLSMGDPGEEEALRWVEGLHPSEDEPKLLEYSSDSSSSLDDEDVEHPTEDTLEYNATNNVLYWRSKDGYTEVVITSKNVRDVLDHSEDEEVLAIAKKLHIKPLESIGDTARRIVSDMKQREIERHNKVGGGGFGAGFVHSSRWVRPGIPRATSKKRKKRRV